MLIIRKVCSRQQESLFPYSHVAKKQIFKKCKSIFSKGKSKYRHSHINMKENADIFSYFLLSDSYHSIRTSAFSLSLKQGNITKLFKRGEKNFKENYSPVGTLTNMLQVFEHI